MNKITLIVAASCLTACGPMHFKSGASVAAPLALSLSAASKAADKVYASGAKPKDSTVHVIQTSLKQAQGQLIVVTKTIDSQNQQLATDQTTIAAKNHRIFIDDIIFGIPIAILGGMIVFQLVKVFAL